MSETKMPERWDLVGEYDSYMSPIEEGDWVKAEDVEPLVAEITRLRAEVLEQARLLGMGSEREAKLLARIKVLERQHPVVATAGCQCPSGANIHCANSWCPRKSLSFRVTSAGASK